MTGSQDHFYSIPFPGASVSFSHSASIAFSINHTFMSSFSLTVLSLIAAYFSHLPFLLFSLSRLPLIDLSLRSHLAITSSCRLCPTSLTLLSLLISSPSLFTLCHASVVCSARTTSLPSTLVSPSGGGGERREERMGTGAVTPVGSAPASCNGLSDRAELRHNHS